MMKARDDVKQGNIFQRQRKFKDSDTKDLLDSSKSIHLKNLYRREWRSL